jgi:hypothetical protein
MSKKLILALAMAVVLVSGFLYSAQAECGFGCSPQMSSPSCLSCSRDADQQPARDSDKPNIPCQGSCFYGPAAPEPMGSPGF